MSGTRPQRNDSSIREKATYHRTIREDLVNLADALVGRPFTNSTKSQDGNVHPRHLGLLPES